MMNLDILIKSLNKQYPRFEFDQSQTDGDALRFCCSDPKVLVRKKYLSDPAELKWTRLNGRDENQIREELFRLGWL